MNEMTSPPQAGHNAPPPYDAEVLESLAQQARDFADAAGAWKEAGPIETSEQAEKANDFLAQGRKLFKSVEDTRKAEKEPHLSAGRQIDKDFKTVTSIVETAAGMVKPLVEAFLKEQQRIADERRREEQRRAAEEAARAEEARKAAEARNDAVGMAEADAAADAAQETAKEAEKASSAKVGSATGAGRTAALRTKKVVTIVNDLAMLRHYRNHPEMKALLMKLAQAEARAGAAEIPGCEIKEEKVL